MSRRTEKAAELIKQQVSRMVKKTISEEMGMVTITTVILSEDLKLAKVFYSCFKSSYKKVVANFLEERKYDFQHQLGKILEMKYTPKLEFKVDPGLEDVNKVEAMLNKI